jgi:hypothetical protein
MREFRFPQFVIPKVVLLNRFFASFRRDGLEILMMTVLLGPTLSGSAIVLQNLGSKL